MKKKLFSFILLLMFSITAALFSAKEIKIEVLYMNHGPLQETLGKMKQIFSKYGSKISVSWYDFESKEGEAFKASKGIKEHMPLTIWIEGKSTVAVKGKEIKFTGFPTGSGPAFFQGKWTMENLQNSLDQITNTK
jgi:hypothetical protein